ncbi:MAG: dehydrogenase [Aquificaceae bacterium]
MALEPTNLPLAVKKFDALSCGFCAGCGCSCGYILYKKDRRVVDLYGHPKDPNGMGSFCAKGIAYIQELYDSPLRLKRPYLWGNGRLKEISLRDAISIAKENLKGKVAFLLDRTAGLEEYLLAREISEEVFCDAPYLPFRASSLRPQEWKDKRLIIAWEAYPVYSEVMSTRWIVDAIEKGSYLSSISSRYDTLMAKAQRKHLVTPYEGVRLLEKLMESEERFLKKLLVTMKSSLILVGSSLLLSNFGCKVVNLLRKLREKFGVDYSLVGDIMPFPAKDLGEFSQKLEAFDTIIVFGNPFRFLKKESLEKLKGKFVLHFSLFPNLTAHYATLVIPSLGFAEREFINYRHGFGFLSYSPKTLEPLGVDPYLFLSEVFGTGADLRSFLKLYGIDLELLKDSLGGQGLDIQDVADVDLPSNLQEPKRSVYICTDNGMVEEMGHWLPWTHEMEKYQKAYMSKETAKKLSAREKVNIRGTELEVVITPNVADDVVFVPSSFEEYQPFDPGVSVGMFLEKPHYRYEVLE